MLSALVALALTVDPWCDDIRAVRALAHRDHLDETSLTTLESRYCPALPQVGGPSSASSGAPKASEGCSDVWTMAVLARASRDYAELPAIDALVRQTCSPGAVAAEVVRWADGHVAHQGDAWWYPSGKGAKKGSSWWYPTGRAAHDAITWWYPSGSVARSGDVWFDPETGVVTTSEGLVSGHCAGRPTFCKSRLGAVRGVGDDGHTAGTIELVLATP